MYSLAYRIPYEHTLFGCGHAPLICIFDYIYESALQPYFQQHIENIQSLQMNTKSSIGSMRTTFSQQKCQFSQPVTLHRGQRYISSKIDSQLAVAFSIPQQDVVELFEDIAASLDFQMIQSEQNYATAVKRPQKTNIFQLLNCLTWWGSSRQVNAIKLIILNSPTASDSTLKLCKIRSLSQPTPEVLEKLQKIKGIVPSAYLFQPNSYSEEATYQNNSNPFHLQACSYYMFHKILTSSTGAEQKIRKNLQKALQDFSQAFKNIEQSSLALPTPMLNIIDIIRQTCQQIGKLFIFKQQSNESNQTIMPFMKIAIEKYVFDTTEAVLKAMYLYKDKQATEQFLQKRNKILARMTKQQIFQQVLLRKNLRQIEPHTPHSSSRGGIEFCVVACPQLQKIKQTSSPREKIKYCQLMYAQLKSYFYEKLKMKYQLSTMQDIIPVFIVVVLYTQQEDLRSQLNLMIDYIHATDEDFEAEKRLLVNLSESYNYIVRDWRVDD